MKFTPNKKIAYIDLNAADFKRCGATEDDTEEIVNQGLYIPGVLMSILFCKSNAEDPIRVSFRSKLHVNVCWLSEKFGGGGHKYAAGCKLNATLEKAIPIVLKSAIKAV